MKPQFSEKDCLEWAVAEIIGKEELVAALASGKKLRVKLGIDPTSPNIHLGRSIPLWRLRAFQELGHEIHFIIGDFTGQIGDTSDKDAERPMLLKDEIEQNLLRYMEQVWMILDPEKKDQVHVHYNSEWLLPLTLSDLSRMADAFSVNQFIKRELIARRLENAFRVSLREMLYPLMQGYDSVMVQANVELGGTDQRFNLLAGRTLQEQSGQPPQAIIMNPLIAGTDGRKMSSSWGNVISLLDSAEDKYGKVMAISDELLQDYLTFLPFSTRPFTAHELSTRLSAGENPRDLKMSIAFSLVDLYHGDEIARQVAGNFSSLFSNHRTPEEMPELEVDEGEDLGEIVLKLGYVTSKSELRRLIDQGGVRLDGIVLSDYPISMPSKNMCILQVGKRKFARLIPRS